MKFYDYYKHPQAKKKKGAGGRERERRMMEAKCVIRKNYIIYVSCCAEIEPTSIRMKFYFLLCDMKLTPNVARRQFHDCQKNSQLCLNFINTIISFQPAISLSVLCFI